MRRETIAMRRANSLWRDRAKITVALNRRPRTSDGAGGWTLGPPQQLEPQSFRVAATARQHEMTSETLEGRLQGADWLLVGDPDADVERGDWFTHAGREWRVRFVDVSDRTRRAAGVVEHGSA